MEARDGVLGWKAPLKQGETEDSVRQVHTVDFIQLKEPEDPGFLLGIKSKNLPAGPQRTSTISPKCLKAQAEAVQWEAHLKEALHILQNVDPTVTEVVLLGNVGTGPSHDVLAEAPLGALLSLPLHLQVPAGGQQQPPNMAVSSALF